MRTRTFRLVSGAAVGVGAAAALLLATYLIHRVAQWDVSAFRGLQLLGGHSNVAGLAHGVVRLADPLPAAAMLAAICLAGVAWGRPRHAAAAALLVGGAAITALVLKAVLAHPRYQALLGSDQLAADAFPSGHSTTGISVGFAAVIVAPRRWRLVAAIAAASYALAVGVSVVITGWHYPSDVLGAFLITGSLGLLTVAALRASESEGRADGAFAWPFGRLPAGVGGPLVAVAGSAAVTGSAVALSHAHKLLSYASTETSAVVAALGITLASVALVYGIAAEAGGR